MEESHHECTEALTGGKLHELLTDSDNDAGPFPFEEKTIEEVMQEFYKEIIACPKPPSQTPLSSPSLSEQYSPSYFPNAKVELEMPAAAETENGSQLVVELPDAGSDEFVGLKVGQENEMDQRHDEDEGDFDEEWMARVLGCAQGQGQGQGQVVDSSECDQWF